MNHPISKAIAALGMVLLCQPASGAEQKICAGLKTVLENPYPSEPIDSSVFRRALAEAESTCDVVSARALINDPLTEKVVRPLVSVADAKGFWVSDYWLTAAIGVSVPYVDTIEIIEDGSLTQRWWRWFDPVANEAHGKPDAIRIYPDLMPVGVTGRLEVLQGGMARLINADLKTVQFESPIKGRPDLEVRRSRHILAIRPRLTAEFRMGLNEDRLAITDADGLVRTYRRFGKEDVRLLHGLIRVSEVYAGYVWPCLLRQIREGGNVAKKLRAAAKHSLELLGVLDRLFLYQMASHNARILTGKGFPFPGEEWDKESVHVVREKAPELSAWIDAQPGADQPFGCKKLE